MNKGVVIIFGFLALVMGAVDCGAVVTTPDGCIHHEAPSRSSSTWLAGSVLRK